MKQAVLNRIRVFNKHVTNKLLIHIAGKNFGHFAVLSHTGRKSGRLYRIPVIAEPLDGGFVFALTYGKNVDWYKNIAASGSCSICWKHRDYDLIRPEFIEPEQALAAFPKLLRPILRRNRIEYYLKMDVRP